MVAAEDFTAAVEADFMVALQGVSMVAGEVTMATAADTHTSVTMEAATAADIPTLVTMGAATTVDTVAMVGMEATDGMVATTVGTADIGAIHTTATDGAGDGVLALGGRIGVGDTRMATATALGITLPTITTTRIIVLRDTHVLPTGTMTLRLRIPAPNPGATQQRRTGTMRPVMSPP
jgi:hypothetical protein